MTPTNSAVESRLDIPLKRWIPINLETLLVVLILLLAVVSRFYDLGLREISFDEVNHVVPSYDLFSGHGYSYDPLSHGPLQFHMMALSFALFGDSDFTARIPAAIFSVATIALALLIFRRYLGRIGALAAGFMCLISPYLLFYGRYTRNEAYTVIWGMLTLYCILRYMEKGEKRILLLFTLINAFHFTDKATSYIFAAEELIFLAGYFTYRLLNREWAVEAEKERRSFIAGLLLAVVLFGGAAWVYLTQKPLDKTMIIVAGVVGAGGVAGLVFAAVSVVRGLGWGQIRSERTFDLLMLLGTLILPLLGALPLKLIGLDPLDYSRAGIYHALEAILPLVVLAVLLGLWWKGWEWLLYVALFYVPFAVLYTTFFTNPVGLAGGFMGALGYWMEQQPVDRGTQPLYYYALVQVPIYEFLPAVGTIAAALIALFKKLWQSEPGSPFVPGKTVDAETQRVPTAALLVYWSVSSLVVFSLAGERMPWLTVNIALPMILASGWAVGWLVETVPWGKINTWTRQNVGRAVVLAFLSLLAVITVRTAYRAAYINYDYPLEYLVYAHIPADPKTLYNEIVDLSRRTTGELNMVVAYDNKVRYPYWWYMRHFPNKIDFDVTPTLDARRAEVILVGSENYDKITPVVRNDYNSQDYMLLWWPNEDYKSITWPSISSERTADLCSTTAGSTSGTACKITPMNLFEYLKYAWKHIQPFFTNAKIRSAVWQIWFNRDYSQWAALKNSDAYTLTNWGVSDRMRFYISKDIASKIWTYGAVAQPATQPVDPYVALTLPFTSDRTIGAPGNGAGQFQAPHEIALAPDGSLYVADAGNNRIQHVSAQGQVLQVWGTFADISKGNAPGGTFNEPWGVAVGPDGSVYVADTWNHRIQKFTADGKFLTMWGHGPADSTDAFYGPRGIAVDAQGRVFVADTGNKRIMIFDSNGKLLGQIGGPGFDPGQFDEPVGVALDASGKLYVTDTWNQRVQMFAPDSSGLNFSPVAQWPVEGWYGQSLANKPFLVVDGQGNVFVSDPEACRVIEFGPTGQALHAWGSCGQTGNFTLPDGLALDGQGGLWVSDAGSGSLIHYKLEGP